MPTRTRWSSPLVASLTELVLPGGCAGCGGPGAGRYGVCGRCAGVVVSLVPGSTRPDPAPPGLPPCAALGDYDGVLRELVVAYKDRGRHRLARPLGRLLAHAVAALPVTTGPHPAGRPGGAAVPPLLLVPVPDTPAAARARHGDHLWRLARPAAARLRAAGLEVALARPLRARPRPDSTGLDTAARAAAAQAALRGRSRRLAALRRRAVRAGAVVVLLDDVVTTGATLAAATRRLRTAGVPVAGAAVLAATRRRT